MTEHFEKKENLKQKKIILPLKVHISERGWCG